MNASVFARRGGLLRCLSGGLQSSSRLPGAILGGCRTLYAPSAIGVDGYEKQRERTSAQFSGMGDKFREKMKEFTGGDGKNMIFTEDLKNMVYLAENKPEDLDLVVQMVKRFNSQNKHLRFGNYVFGPVVMRMYYFLNQPKQALDIFNDPELEGFFDQLSSYQILCDLLYNNQMYQEVLDVFEIVKNRQTQGTRYPRNVVILVFASCYKMNTVQSYEYALKVLQEMKAVGSEPVRRVVSYAAALALEQNAPNVALEILALSGVSNYVTIRNLKIRALADLGRPDDALPILRHSMEFDNPGGDRRSTVFSDILEKVSSAVQKLDKKEVTTEFERIVKALQETNQISKENITSVIDAEIAPPRPDQLNQQQRGGLRIGQSIDLRARRNPTFQKDFRERRSIMTE